MENNGVLELKWGTSSPFRYNDPEYGQIELLLTGICHYMISNNNNLFANKLFTGIFALD